VLCTASRGKKSSDFDEIAYTIAYLKIYGSHVTKYIFTLKMVDGRYIENRFFGHNSAADIARFPHFSEILPGDFFHRKSSVGQIIAFHRTQGPFLFSECSLGFGFRIVSATLVLPTRDF